MGGQEAFGEMSCFSWVLEEEQEFVMSIERVRGTLGQRKLPGERPRSVRCMRHLENCWNISGGPEGAAQSEVGAQGRSQITGWGGDKVGGGDAHVPSQRLKLSPEDCGTHHRFL